MTAVATRTLDVLHVQPETRRAFEAIDALARAAGPSVQVRQTSRYTGDAEWLLLWGPGEPSRMAVTRQHVANGGHVIALDLAYWDRDRKFRVSIDAAHPQAYVMRRELPAYRACEDGIRLEHACDPVGPVIVAGIGEKATVQYGDQVRAWEEAMTREAVARGYRVLYRPKKHGVPPAGADLAPAGPINPVLRGAALVITWHSNVAVDAIRLGIPVICRDGAAAAVSPATWLDDLTPMSDPRRERFLANLAWFQWAPSEAAACWAWLTETLS